MHQEPVLKKILHGLTSGGVCIFTTGGLDAPSEKVDSAMGPQMYYSVLGIPNLLKQYPSPDASAGTWNTINIQSCICTSLRRGLSKRTQGTASICLSPASFGSLADLTEILQ